MAVEEVTLTPAEVSMPPPEKKSTSHFSGVAKDERFSSLEMIPTYSVLLPIKSPMLIKRVPTVTKEIHG